MNMKLLKRAASILAIITLLSGCETTNLEAVPAQLGKASSMEQLRASLTRPGTIEFTKHLSANWEINLSGLL
ncbi:MAG: hypothetical protein KUG53_02520, partial [Pseudomonadales bacterium]|nr:hypothetical protein [Pseudomonadales bacterium]